MRNTATAVQEADRPATLGRRATEQSDIAESVLNQLANTLHQIPVDEHHPYHTTRFLHVDVENPKSPSLPPSQRSMPIQSLPPLEQQGLVRGGASEVHAKRLMDLTVNVSFVANLFLLAAKLYIAVTSVSMVLLACAFDSVMDVMSGILIYLTRFYMMPKSGNEREQEPTCIPHSILTQTDSDSMGQADEQYPAGRSLLEPVCTIVYSTVMCSASLQLCFYAIEHLINAEEESPNIEAVHLIVLAFTILVKLILLFFCSIVANRYGGHTNVLASDHRADVLTNTIALILVIVIMYTPKAWWLDDIGCLGIAFTAAVSWFRSDRDHIRVLSGCAADKSFYTTLATLVKDSEHVDLGAIKAYHFGLKYMVELSIVMKPSATVEQCVRAVDALQRTVQGLEQVEKCFVHIDLQNSMPSDSNSSPKGLLQVADQQDTSSQRGAVKRTSPAPLELEGQASGSQVNPAVYGNRI
eukprot:GDKI01009645.1.p1 GENE.GDKI01009645.1~~GDKI01009645.1.p1  ORF type:complete len:468 (-),score=115.44 GDKI01009645.1:241-1644(-)